MTDPQRWRFAFRVILVVGLSFPSAVAFADSDPGSRDQTGIAVGRGELDLLARLADWDLPDYVRKWEFGVQAGEERTPIYSADLMIPLVRPDAEDRILFLEPRFNHAKSETLFNAGLGYRQLFRDRTWMLGGNAFFDHDTSVAHHRFGAGVEAVSSVAEFRANGYWGLSRARTLHSSANRNLVERAVDGFDLEAGFPVPYYSRLKLFGGYEWYDFKKFDNREGWAFRTEYKPWPFLVLDVRLSDNNKRATAWDVKVAVRPALGRQAEAPRSPLKLDEVLFPDGDVGERLTDLVERHHEIVVERYTETDGGVLVEVGRGT